MFTYVYIVFEDAVRQFSSSHQESHVFGSAPDVEKRSGSPRAVERRDSAGWWPEKPPETVGECNKNLGFTGSKTMDLKSKIWGSTWFFECWGFFNGQLTMVLGPTFGDWIKQRQVRVLSSIRHQVRGLNYSKSSHGDKNTGELSKNAGDVLPWWHWENLDWPTVMANSCNACWFWNQ